jgi:hypothetical protein
MTIAGHHPDAGSIVIIQDAIGRFHLVADAPAIFEAVVNEPLTTAAPA